VINGHGGNIYLLAKQLGCNINEIIDMSSNVNPVGPPPGLLTFLKENIERITALPEADAGAAADKFADAYNLDPERVLAGSGTTQFIYSIPLALGSKRVLILGPTYSDYADACLMHNISFRYLTTDGSVLFRHDIDEIRNQVNGCDTVFICNPNNPTGTLIPAVELELLCRSSPETCFIIDESYLPFAQSDIDESMLNSGLSNLIILNSMSKIFRIPGIRIGFLISSKKIAEKLERYALPWSVNSLAQVSVQYLMEKRNETESFIEKTKIFLETEKTKLVSRFEKSSKIKFFPSTTSFLLAELLKDITAERVCDHLAQNRILIRNCTNFKGLSNNFIRISLKTENVNRMLSEKLLNFINGL